MVTDTPIHLVHVTPTISRLGGGVAAYLRSFVQQCPKDDVQATIAALCDRYVQKDAADIQEAKVFTGRYIGPRWLGYSPVLRRFLNQRIGEADIVHSHGLRMLPSYEARRLAVRRGVPLVISPHGQLDPWILGYGKLRKKIIGLLYENRNLQNAACIHVTSNQEARHVRAYGLRNPIAVVPIGLDAAEYPVDRDDGSVIERWPQLKGKKRLLFLSMIYRKKGLCRLAQAWGRLWRRYPDWQLVIAGQELDDDRARAQQIITSTGAGGCTTFVGPVVGELKKQLLGASDLYVLPTEGENFGITIAEAMACGLPAIVSNTTPWGALARDGCGWWIDVGVEPLCTAMQQAMGLSDAQRQEMGRRGRRVIEENYAWPVIVRQMIEMYRWLLGRSDKPGFVYLPDEQIND